MIEMIIDLFTDGIVGSILAVLLIFLILIVCSLILYAIYYCVDSFFRPNNESYGIIRDMTFTPAHTETIWILNAALKQNIPHDWSVSVEINGLIGDISISEQLYDTLAIDNSVFVKYSTGRLNKNNLYIKSISK